MKLMYFHKVIISAKKLARQGGSLWIKLLVLATVSLVICTGLQLSHHRSASPAKSAHSVAAPKPKQPTSAPLPSGSVPAGTTDAASTTPATPPAATSTKTVSVHTLSISPATIVMYKKPAGVNPTIKPGATNSVPFTITTSDGKGVNLPFSAASAGVIWTTTHDPTPYKQTWPMTADSTYASVGTFSYTLTAKSATGITYSGVLQVIVKPMPIFTVTAPVELAAYATAQSDDDLVIDGFDAMQFDFSAVSDFMPRLTFGGDGWGCSVSLTNSDDSACDAAADNMLPATYSAHLSFENQFQNVVFPLGFYLSP